MSTVAVIDPKREPLKDITNKPPVPQKSVDLMETAMSRPQRRARGFSTPARRQHAEALDKARTRARERLLHIKLLEFVNAVEEYAEEYKIANLLDMLYVFKAEYRKIDKVD
ncbi:g7765 [Coccomyxa elongata]